MRTDGQDGSVPSWISFKHDIAAAGAGDDQYPSSAVGGPGGAMGEGTGVAESEECGQARGARSQACIVAFGREKV